MSRGSSTAILAVFLRRLEACATKYLTVPRRRGGQVRGVRDRNLGNIEQGRVSDNPAAWRGPTGLTPISCRDILRGWLTAAATRPWDIASGGLAQLGERLAGSQKVRGSSPLSSTKRKLSRNQNLDYLPTLGSGPQVEAKTRNLRGRFSMEVAQARQIGVRSQVLSSQAQRTRVRPHPGQGRPRRRIQYRRQPTDVRPGSCRARG